MDDHNNSGVSTLAGGTVLADTVLADAVVHETVLPETVLHEMVLADAGVVSQGTDGCARDERGLTTVEYAVGLVLVITIVGLLITAANQGWFMDLVKVLVRAIFAAVTGVVTG
ncbi:hypothetical protein [Propioniciclava soli]|uniref:DUF4244 domain-containing protein n=1 Tax=Propioniciclava soli TaxID=2775081 RepID=A0ABZ3CA12_9ACTN|nr:hypothetical protein [Propioniciclava soli]